MTRRNLDGTRLFFAIASLLVCTNRMVAGANNGEHHWSGNR
jgi:hypothetical protein